MTTSINTISQIYSKVNNQLPSLNWSACHYHFSLRGQQQIDYAKTLISVANRKDLKVFPSPFPNNRQLLVTISNQ